ncbi:MAG: hypothetical protein RLZZ400_867 [Actinomycetota bacterium]
MNQTTKTVAQLARGRALLFGLGVPEAIETGIDSLSAGLSLVDAEVIRGSSIASMQGLGPLQPLLDDPSIEEIWVNRPNEIWFADARGNRRIQVELSSADIENYVARMLRVSSRRLDRSNPFVDSTLADGSRLHVVIPNVTREHWSINIRKFRVAGASLVDLQRLGMLSIEQVEQLRDLMARGRSIVISGATQSGKTTLLTALLNELGDRERLVTVEDTFEISCKVEDWVALQTREAVADSESQVDLRRLVRETLRMRPTRIAVGEVRGSEALEMLLAFNSGIPGLCTIHANSASHALQKLESLPLLAGSGISSELVQKLVQSNVGAVAHCVRVGEQRQLQEVLEVADV